MRKMIVFVALVMAAGVNAQEVLHVTNGALLSVKSGATLGLNGGITLDNGSTLMNAGLITLSKNSAGTNSDWIDKGVAPYRYGSGVVRFGSSSNQTVQGIDSFDRIEVNSNGLSLSGDILSKQWYLIKGPVTTGSYHAVVTNTAATGVVADAANPGFTKSWIDGNLRRYVDFTGVDQYSFPVGPGANANQVVMDNLLAAPLVGVNYIDVHFAAKPGTDAGLVLTEDGTPYTMVNGAGVWYLTPDAEPVSGAYDLLLYTDGFIGLVDNRFAILRRPDGSSNAADWAIPTGGVLPAAGSPGRVVASGYARRNGIKAFSQFGIGMTQTPLPIVLAAFEARRVDKANVALTWETSMEANNKGFDVESRMDADTAFGSRAFVASEAPGGNSSSALTYSYRDANSYAGVSYYRLRQVDFDGRYTYSMIRAVSGDGLASVAVSLFPNPSKGQFKVRMEGISGKKMVRIVGAGGAIVQVLQADGGSDLLVGGLSAGAYIVQVVDAFGPGKSFVEKLMVVK
jgi:hypothetical protein